MSIMINANTQKMLWGFPNNFSVLSKKKLTWSPPVSHFIHFLVNQLQDQPLFQEKKIDRGTPIEGFQEYFKATFPPPKKKGEK